MRILLTEGLKEASTYHKCFPQIFPIIKVVELILKVVTTQFLGLQSCLGGQYLNTLCTPTEIHDEEEKKTQMQSLVEQLPAVNRETLKRLIGHLKKYEPLYKPSMVNSIHCVTGLWIMLRLIK